MHQTVREVAAEVNRAPPPSCLAQTERRNPADLDAAPHLMVRISLTWIVVSPPAAHDRDVVAPLHELHREIARVLGRRRDVRVERLIEKEDSHRVELVMVCGDRLR